MVYVKNKKTISMLAKHFMKQNKKRNRILSIAIFLTTVLFTVVFFSAFSMVETRIKNECRDFMCNAHMCFNAATKEEAEHFDEVIKQRDDVVKVGKARFIGLVANDEVKYTTEIYWADANYVEASNCPVTVGRLPKKSDEIACNTYLLQCLGVEKKLGEKVTLIIDRDNGEGTCKKTFRLCGYFEGDKTRMSQMAWVHKDVVKELCTIPYTSSIRKQGYSGCYERVLWFDSAMGLEKKGDEIRQEFKNYEASPDVNPSYLPFEEDGFSIPSLCLFVFIIFLAGYLVIYNIFNISVKNDIKVFGLFKNIGVTNKQMKKIVFQQAVYLCFYGIPAGLITGFAVSYFMLPIVLSGADYENKQQYFSVHPIIFVISAIISMITVFIGFIKPYLVIKKLTPVEALRYADQIKAEKVHKKKKKVSPAKMAFTYMRKNLAKGALIMVSMALSLVILNSVIMIVKGLSFEEYVSYFISNDIKVNKITQSMNICDYKGISEEQIEILRNCPNVEKMGLQYYNATFAPADASLLRHIESASEKYDNYMKREKPKEYEEYAEYNENISYDDMEVTYNIFGINRSMFEKLKFKDDEKISWEEFCQGDHTLVSYLYPDVNETTGIDFGGYYDINEKVDLNYENGNKVTGTIIGYAELPDELQSHVGTDAVVNLFVPDERFIKDSGTTDAMNVVLDVKDGCEKEAIQYIKDNIQKNDELVQLYTMDEYKKEFSAYINHFLVIGGLLVIIFGIIGIMNFINTSVAGMIARKRELSLLEAVGMTKKQIVTMLSVEGFIYVGVSILFAIMFTCFGAKKLVLETVGGMYYLHMKVTIISSLLFVPVLCFIAFAIPYFGYQKMEKESLVERMKYE